MERDIFNKIRKPIVSFFKIEASSGILLAFFALIAMVLANSELSSEYFSVLNFKIINLTVQHWINDAFMVIFFFLIGMEIKKEMVAGELRSPKKAALPIAAAMGGMVFPAIIYYFLNPEYPDSKGWGIPMATDIAFALGVLTIFGNRASLSLKIFLLAIAIVDDLGAILVIAFFYTTKINVQGLAIAAVVLGIMMLVKSIGIKNYSIYILLGFFVWVGVLLSGVHATIAGVLIGLLTPYKFPTERKSTIPYSPLEYLVHKLHPWVSFGIMPIFALANAGVVIKGVDIIEIIKNPIHQGVALGLLIGKPMGILVFSLLAVKFKLAQLPSSLSWRDVTAVGVLAGIGFTMALFISNLALYPQQEIYSKTGIIIGSIIAAIAGSILLAVNLPGKVKNSN
jgi:NhaA family Na+:H+ antiporter